MDVKHMGLQVPIPCFDQTTLSKLILETVQTFRERDPLVFLDAPVNIVGPVYGNLPDLVKLLTRVGRFVDQVTVFLGGYIGQGEFSLECLTLVLALFNAYPDNFVLLRGKTEFDDYQNTTLMSNIVDRFGANSSLSRIIPTVFGMFPLLAIVDREEVCTAGGIGTATLIRELKRAKDDTRKHELAGMIVNANPEDEVDTIDSFLNLSRCKKIVSGAKVVKAGVEATQEGRVLFVSSTSSVGTQNRIGFISVNRGSKVKGNGISPSRPLARVYARFEIYAFSVNGTGSRMFAKSLALEQEYKLRPVGAKQAISNLMLLSQTPKNDKNGDGFFRNVSQMTFIDFS